MSTDFAPRGVWRIVAAREIAVKLRDRNFLVSTAITIVVIIVSLAISGFMSNRTDEIDVAVVGTGADRIVETANALAASADKKITFTARPQTDSAAVEQQVRDEDVEVGLVAADQGGWRLVGDTAQNDDAATYLTAAAQQLAVQRNAAAAGLSMEELGRGGVVSYDLLEESAVDPGLANIVSFVFAFLFYMASFLFGMAIAQSVVEEKQNRVVEILASAIPLRQLLIGKVMGNTVMAFAQLALFVGAGLIGLQVIGRGDQVARIAGAAGWFIVFFVVGFLALASFWAVAGALATRSEDLQSTAMPMSMLIMIVLFAGIFLTGTWRVIASYVPVVSIVAMPSRLAEGTAAWWEPFVSLLLMAVGIYGIVLVAEKIYRRSLMQTQGRLTMRQALAVED
ncbi:ABC-2 type transport system permease protein [Nocardia amikacinitolerans]|uniref:ABC transporter permease n=1 Tax=Nocardia amikacinitolerans TaxID=756689 RepID=UPI0020A58A88|nr:ABC transporter permease [Nocardia amikacinitolerans]MCP2297527.1 ABC-2 type transport system permease protein [Nocardia amikacinitolerans]